MTTNCELERRASISASSRNRRPLMDSWVWLPSGNTGQGGADRLDS